MFFTQLEPETTEEKQRRSEAGHSPPTSIKVKND
jgi:hypothetical protein